MRIGDREIGPGHPAYVIAEIGVNHDGSLERALELIDSCAHAGADAVKFQAFTPERLMSSACRLAAYQKDAGESDPIEMLSRLQLTPGALGTCVERAHERGIHAIVTPFTLGDLDDVDSLGWDAFKTASPDLINKPLLDAIATTDAPMIVSTGASTLDEVVRACGWLAPARDRLCFLQCVSAYPTDGPLAALGGIAEIDGVTGVPTGYSDHTSEIATGAIAVGAGACALEKHVTHDRGASGPDHAASLEPDQFTEYVRLAKLASEMTSLGKRVQEIERDVRTVSRQSVCSSQQILTGTTIDRGMLAIKRPGTGIEPWEIGSVIGAVAKVDIDADHPIERGDLA